MKKIITFITLLIVLASCSPKTSYQDINKSQLSSYFSVQDQVNLVNQLSNKMINDPVVKESVHNRPTLLVDTIKNKTSEHIDTESITDTLKTTIISNHLFRIINRNNINLLTKEQNLNNMGLTDSNRATELGKLWGAKFVLYGNFSSIVNYVGKSKQTYYKLTMFLQNIETGEEIWVGEGSINKVTK